jgi:hypothetical protein
LTLVIRLTDQQMSALVAASKPISRRARDSFLTTVVEIVRPHIEPDGSVGDGHLYRAVREAQRRHYDPPIEIGGQRGGHHPGID